MAYSELPWRPLLRHQAWSWTTLRRGNVFYYVYKRFLFLSRFYVFNDFNLYLNVFLHVCYRAGARAVSWSWWWCWCVRYGIKSQRDREMLSTCGRCECMARFMARQTYTFLFHWTTRNTIRLLGVLQSHNVTPFNYPPPLTAQQWAPLVVIFLFIGFAELCRDL